MSYFKRKKLGTTDYKKRLGLILSNKPRLVVRRSLKYITAQIIEYRDKGDFVLVSVNTKELSKYDWKFAKRNIPSSYLLGLLIGKKANRKNIKELIFDIGLQRPVKKGNLYAILKGALDSGLVIPYNESILPDELRIKGEHITNFIKSNKFSQIHFTNYKKIDIDKINIADNFNKTKENIIKNA